MVDDSDSSNEVVEIQEQRPQQTGRPPEMITTNGMQGPSTDQEWAETVASIRDSLFLMTEAEAGTWESSDDDDVELDGSDDERDEPVPEERPSHQQPLEERKQREFGSGITTGSKQVMVPTLRSRSSGGTSSFEEITLISSVRDDAVEEDDYEKNFRSFGDMAYNHDSGSDEGEVSDHYSAYRAEQRKHADDYSYEDFLAGSANGESSYEEITVEEDGSFIEVTVSSSSGSAGGSRHKALNGIHKPDLVDSNVLGLRGGGVNPYQIQNDDDDAYNASLSNSMVFGVKKDQEQFPSSTSKRRSSSSREPRQQDELNAEEHDFHIWEESGSAKFFESFAWDAIAEETPSQIESSEASTQVKQSPTKPPPRPKDQHRKSPADIPRTPKSTRSSFNNSISSLNELELVLHLGLTPPTSSKTLKVKEPLEVKHLGDHEETAPSKIPPSPKASKPKKTKSQRKSLGEVLEGNNEFYPKMEDDRTFTGLEIDATEDCNANLSPISLKGFKGVSKEQNLQELKELLARSPLQEDIVPSKIQLPHLENAQPTPAPEVGLAASNAVHGRKKLTKQKSFKRILKEDLDDSPDIDNVKSKRLSKTSSPPPKKHGQGKAKGDEVDGTSKDVKRRPSMKKKTSAKKNDSKRSGSVKRKASAKDLSNRDVVEDPKRKSNLKKQSSRNHVEETNAGESPRKKKQPGDLKKKKSSRKIISTSSSNEMAKKKATPKKKRISESTPKKKRSSKIDATEGDEKARKQQKESASKKKKASTKNSQRLKKDDTSGEKVKKSPSKRKSVKKG